jgi:hypothetical protein
LTGKGIDENTVNKKFDRAAGRPVTYRIQVVGYLDKNWSDRLGGLTIKSDKHEGKSIITTISGSIIDQAALFGVLNALYDMRLPLLSVECLDSLSLTF